MHLWCTPQKLMVALSVRCCFQYIIAESPCSFPLATMPLSKHIDAEKLEHKLLKLSTKTPVSDREEYIFDYSSNRPVPKHQIPVRSSNKDLVLKYIEEELSLDGVPTLNMASFVNTAVEEIPLKLISDNITKNLADNDEYPSLLEHQSRCMSILSDLWHAPKNDDGTTDTIGTSTTGSSEAIMLAGLALKKRWQEKRKAEGKSTENPNIIMSSIAQVALEKFARYFDVENRTINVNEGSEHVIDVNKIKENIDENTIGIFVILGSTFTGNFEPVEEINNLLDEVEKETGLDVKIHVDGASGAFVAPFVYPNLKWDFAVPRVVSINTSGHKFGLTTAGLGWVIWKHNEYLPEQLRFKLDYLGGVEETFNLNFSRPGFPVLHQYYNFLTFGREGYTKIFDSCIQNARLLSEYLTESGYYEVLSVIHEKISEDEAKKIFTLDTKDQLELGEVAVSNQGYRPGLPVVAFRFSKEFRRKYHSIPQSMVSLLLRNKGFIVPNYNLSADEHDKEILRVVVRPSCNLNLLEKLIKSITECTELLLKAYDTVMEVFSKDNTEGPETQKQLIHDLLLSIASDGVIDKKKAQTKLLDKEGTGHHKHKKSYRGAC